MIIELQDVKRYPGMLADDSDDVLLYDIMKRKDSLVKNRILCRDIESGTKTEYLDGDCTDTIILKHVPITAITSIHDDTERVYGSDTLIDSADYTYDAETGIITLDNNITSPGRQNIKVIYTGGYTVATVGTTLPTMPEYLKEAMIKLVIAEFLVSKGQIATIVGDTFTVDRPKRLFNEAMDTLNRYIFLKL
jgi:hypothetical protein